MDRSVPDGIAIIGLAGRFPGASSVNSFWENVRNGVESIRWFSDQDLLDAGVPSELLLAPNYVKASAPLDGVDLFDAPLFNLSPAEAEIMDPQHRLFLECALEGLENAGYSCDERKHRIGVYGGAGINRYLLQAVNRSDLFKPGSATKVVTGNDKDYLTTRVSYKLGLTGPSISVQTACSTSLVAVHIACRSLLDYQVDIALAGGISIRLPQLSGYLYEEGGILSPDGHCRAFDARARGTIFGSGVGIVVLKRLEEAIADGDTIRAVIKGSAVNNDGSAKVGFTAPSVQSQAEVIAEALAVANVDARSIGYVETHGTGTKLGDPIEVAALTKAFRGWTQDHAFCAIGSVKTNVGHLDTAAGVTGLIKVVSALENKLIPPSLNFQTPNPEIDFKNSPFYVNTNLREWTATNSPRRAGVSSFGLGGTNSHLIVEEAPPAPPRAVRTRRRYSLVPVSAKSEAALDEMWSALGQTLSKNAETRLDDVAFTYQVGRKTYTHRRVLIAADREEAIEALRRQDSASVLSATGDFLESPIAYLLPGQGSQFTQMGAELYDEEEVFRHHIDVASDVLKGELGQDLRSILFPAKFGKSPIPRDLGHTSVLQPALFTIEYAMAQLWQSWGVHPGFLLGHSIGEFVAATLSGVMSFEEGLRLTAQRGALIGSLPPGLMLALPISEQEARAMLSSDLSIAAVNGPERTVVSGPPEAILEFEAALTERGITSNRLAVSHAFHSRSLEPIAERFREIVRLASLRSPNKRYISNVTGTWITADEATDPDYWVRHLLMPVRFFDGLRELTAVRHVILLEVGPGQVLTGLARACTRGDRTIKCLASMPELRESGATIKHLRRTQAEIWLAGARVDWGEYQKGSGCRRLPLPGYAFQRSRYWISEKETSQSLDVASANVEPGRDELRLLVPTWRKLAEPATPSNSSISNNDVTLVFYEEPGLAREIVDGLRLDGMDIVRVRIGSTFCQLNEAEYCIDPGEPKEYATLFSALAPRLSGRRLRIVHLLTLRGQGETRDDHVRPFYSLIWIAQAIGSQLAGTPVELVIVSEGAYAVTGAEALVPENALVAGPFNVIPREYPGCAVRWIDADLSKATIAAIGRVISNEIDPSEAIAAYAYRGGKRYQRTLSELCLPAELAEQKFLRPGGTYLITGGLGEIGSATARVLARESQAKLALLGRTMLPSREQWDMSSPEKLNPAVVQRIQTVLDLESLGSVVFPFAADVSDEAQMREAVRRIEASLGKIDGVIHAAGVGGGGLIAAKTMVEVEKVFKPKIDGARVLAKIFSDHQLDFFVCCSSVQSLIGDFGQSEYSAANAFLDTFSHALNRDGTHPCLSINWDTWRDAGMAVKSTAGRREEGSLSLESGISSPDGASLMAQLLGLTLPQIVACRAVFTPRLKQAMRPSAVRTAPNPTGAPPNRDVAPHARPELFTPYIAPETPLQIAIAGVWQDVLGINLVGLDDSLFEVGGDSVAAIQVCQKIQENLGFSLTPAQIFSATTVRSISAIVAGLQPATDLNPGRNRGERRRTKRLGI